MSTNFQDLDPDSPEYEAALRAAQAAEDEANGNVEPEEAVDETEEESDEPSADEPTTEAEEAAVEEGKQEAEPAPIAGVASKDGSRVLPYAALKAERRAARQAANRAEKAEREAQALRQQLEDIKAGKAPAKDDAEISEEELAELEQDFPQVAKWARVAREAKREVEQIKAKQKPAEVESDDEEDAVQDAIDMVPLLATWQATDPEKFQRAIEIDRWVSTSRKWKDKPLVDIYTEVTRLVAAEYDLEFEDDPKPQQQTKTPSKPDPKQVIAQAKRAAPNTLSDLKAGVADPADERVERMSPAKQVALFSRMTDAQIAAHLAKLG